MVPVAPIITVYYYYYYHHHHHHPCYHIYAAQLQLYSEINHVAMVHNAAAVVYVMLVSYAMLFRVTF
jgi:hypothetical protein